MPTQEIRLSADPQLVYPNTGNTVEGLCPYAETIWTGFLGASQILGVQPPMVELFSPDGNFLGRAIQKNHTPIHEEPCERRNPTYFGQPTFLLIDFPKSELKGGIVAVRHDAVFVRPFGSVQDSIRLARIEAEETEKLGGDPKRIDDLLAYIELAVEAHIPQFGRIPSPDELFKLSLAWALQ